MIYGEGPRADNPAPLFPVVAAALIDGAGRVLLQQRPADKSLGGLWEFPGGKIEAGESPEAALVRELHEELAISVEPAALEPAGFATEPLPGRHLVLLLYVVRQWSGIPVALEADGLIWCEAAAMDAWPIPPADVPLVRQLRSYLADRTSGDGESDSAMA
ncbi:(deoxy)nucleoside triphosphate pyrophosphohydrolase [Sphingomonas sanguinis]|uniref:(deoxy)nucleoside triphosphate pyrophosphohydrolase n=1 Tax=Sphingomonas sp. LC-1 TaxID=3110957 RepID=UPI0021BBAB58|nr:(deoxy)nucleoside triphosphate pyrophosphohydrolase [Sphingomonas sp. LC-1]MCT8000408.1 (deoxy)nucleoside triphosphate pyrophosphohydrolase [Sphingomonas sp. LC-1]